MRQSAQSKMFVKYPVRRRVAGIDTDPTSLPVQFAFTSSGAPEPTAGDAVTGSWETTPAEYLARCLVGPGGAKVLAKGQWDVWIRIIDAQETPFERMGEGLTIY